MSPLFIIGVALLGLGIIIAPIVKKAVTRATKHNGDINFKKAKMSVDNAIDDENEDFEKYDTLYRNVGEYNDLIYENKQEGLTGAFIENGDWFGAGDCSELTVFGIIRIVTTTVKRKGKKREKTIEQTLEYPIFTKTDKNKLRTGFGVMPMTSFPLGEPNSLSVLYGLPKDSFIKGKKCVIKKGTLIHLSTVFDELTYKVTDMGFIEETDARYYLIQEGKSEIMLLMCFPHSGERFCIYASLVDEDSEYNMEEDTEQEAEIDEDDAEE